MALTRTPSGISNQIIFYKTDFMVFVEGGRDSYSVPDVLKGSMSRSSDDISFWSKVFMAFGAGIRVKIRAVGSKKTLIPIAEMVSRGEVENTIVAMDRDHDFYLNKQINHNRIIYTHGYSWENDVFNTSTMLETIKCVSKTDAIDIHEIDKAHKFHNTFAKKMKPAAKFDIALSKQDMSFIQKNQTGSGIISDKSLNINSATIKSLAVSKKNDIKKHLTKDIKRLDAPRHVYGHMYAHYCYNIIKSISASISKAKPSKETVTILVFEKFYEWIIDDKDPIACHYADAIGKAIV